MPVFELSESGCLKRPFKQLKKKTNTNGPSFLVQMCQKHDCTHFIQRTWTDRATYITENLICLARTYSILLLGVAGPLVQVGAVEDVAQHVLAPLGHFIGDSVRRDVSLGFGLMVVLLVQSLSRTVARQNFNNIAKYCI